MKTAKEIEKLAFDTILSEQGKLGFVVGYNCCQKDISKEFYESEEDMYNCMEYYLIYKQSLIDDKSFSFYVKEGFWSLSINEALFFNTKKEADSVIENNKDLKLSIKKIILN
jgi:hypothetical protein